MIDWLTWLFRRRDKSPTALRVLVFNRVQLVYPVGLRGMHLLVRTESGEEAVVSDAAAFDKRQFYNAWKSLGGNKQGLRWEDGTPFAP